MDELTKSGLSLLICEVVAEMIFRDTIGTSPTKAFEGIYGEKFKKEGFEFNHKRDKLMDDFYNNVWRKAKEQ